MTWELQGTLGGESSSYTHNQTSPSTLWTVNPPWPSDRVPVSITVYIDRLGALIESTDSVIISLIDEGPSFTVDVGNVAEAGKVMVS